VMIDDLNEENMFANATHWPTEIFSYCLRRPMAFAFQHEYLLKSLPVQNEAPHRSALVVSVPQGSLVRLVIPWLFSHDFLPLSGPGAGTLLLLLLLFPMSVTLSFSAVNSDLTDSGVKSS
jgi:hypothetical protein